MAKVKNKYEWSDNVNDAPLLEGHTKIKHDIIRDYVRSYLKVVCNPQTRKVKLIIVDGFCGGGLYKTDKGQAHYGSPIILINTIRETVAEVIGDRVKNNIKHEFSLECELYFVDKDKKAIEVLNKVAAPFLLADSSIPLKLTTHFICGKFADEYRGISDKIRKTKAIFIIDPCGYSEAPLPVIREIMHEPNRKREVIWTFMYDSLQAYANDDSTALKNAGFENLLKLFEKGDKPSNFCLQKEIYDTVKKDIGVPFFTPFAVKQTAGWSYWIIHLAWHYRASEVMKEVEHLHANEREHYGQSGLNMMAAEGNRVYLFGQDDLNRGKAALMNDIPQLLSQPKIRDGLSFHGFMEATYNETPLVSNAIKEVLINHPDIEILTSKGGKRSAISGIDTEDVIRLKRQGSFILVQKS
jgi:three-Cys-motif partner protein